MLRLRFAKYSSHHIDVATHKNPAVKGEMNEGNNGNEKYCENQKANRI